MVTCFVMMFFWWQYRCWLWVWYCHRGQNGGYQSDKWWFRIISFWSMVTMCWMKIRIHQFDKCCCRYGDMDWRKERNERLSFFKRIYVTFVEIVPWNIYLKKCWGSISFTYRSKKNAGQIQKNQKSGRVQNWPILQTDSDEQVSY